MKKGFVFGKYYPFHLGHKALIDFALTKCETVYVLICCSNKEMSISPLKRLRWIQETFDESHIIPVLVEYDESALPNTSVSSKEVSRLWAEKFKQILPMVDVLVTSEPYGKFVADYMNIEHFPFDQNRVKFPISSSMIKKEILNCWSYLPDVVKKDYQIKVAFLGTESTGKSSLASALTKVYDSSLVMEAGRDIITNSNNYSKQQLEQIVTSHTEQIKRKCNELKPIVFIDTNVYITQSYHKFWYGEYMNLDETIYDINKADLYLYLNTDLPFQQDGTRLEKEARDKLDLCHRATLKHFEIDFIEVSGSWSQRFETILNMIKHFRLF